MIRVLQPRTCEHCEKKFLIKCHCQTTPEEFAANRSRTLEAMEKYQKSMAELKEKYPDLNLDCIC